MERICALVILVAVTNVHANSLYLLGGTNENCPLNTIVATATECQLAAADLEMQYKYELLFSDVPAGWYARTDFETVFFNKKILSPKTIVDLTQKRLSSMVSN